MTAAALVAVFAFILTRGSSPAPESSDGLRLGTDTTGAPAAPTPPVATDDASATKADRNPPASSKAAPTTAPSVNTGATSPAFARGQWIVVLDTYPTDVGMDADQLAKGAATKLIQAGVPAKAMLVDGQYPGIASSSAERVTDTWMLYLGPGESSDQMLKLCTAPKTQRAHPNTACPTYEPASAAGS
ncbi:hypothetical protein [Kribbella sp. NPDC055071]